MKYEAVIGLEVHCELKTKSKMFSASPVTFGEPYNTMTNVVDLGFTGTMPVLNKKGVEYALRVCHALNMEIDTTLVFDRKNYYYSDLPKGFQITQDKRPIGRNGYLDVEVDGESKRVEIERLHMEEDTAKQVHYSDFTLIDYNRAGIPLIEIVTKPTLRSGKEAAAYLEKLRSIFLYTEVSDAKLEEGSMRCDVNISLRPFGQEKFGTKTEIKNLNSISNVQKALEYEIERQTQLLDSGEEVRQETLRFNEATKQTVKMRDKGDAVDYKYYTEPNILPIQLDETWVASIKASLPEMADQRASRYVNDYQLPEADAKQLVTSKVVSDYYEKCLETSKEYKLLCNWLLGGVPAYLSKNHLSFEEMVMQPKQLSEMVDMIKAGKISGKQAKEVFEEMMVGGKNPSTIAEEKGMKQMSDTTELKAIAEGILTQNPQLIEDYRNGKTRAVGFIVGQIMKATKGQANPKLTNELVTNLLKEKIA